MACPICHERPCAPDCDVRATLADLQRENARLASELADAMRLGTEAWEAHREAVALISEARRSAAAWKGAAEKAVDETRRHVYLMLRTMGHATVALDLEGRLKR